MNKKKTRSWWSSYKWKRSQQIGKPADENVVDQMSNETVRAILLAAFQGENAPVALKSTLTRRAYATLCRRHENVGDGFWVIDTLHPRTSKKVLGKELLWRVGLYIRYGDGLVPLECIVYHTGQEYTDGYRKYEVQIITNTYRLVFPQGTRFRVEQVVGGGFACTKYWVKYPQGWTEFVLEDPEMMVYLPQAVDQQDVGSLEDSRFKGLKALTVGQGQQRGQVRVRRHKN